MKISKDLKLARFGVMGLLYIASLLFSQASQAQLCGSILTWSSDKMRYCRDKSINVTDSNVTRTVIIVHGTPSDARGIYDSLLADRNAEGIGSEVTIIAPHFFESEQELEDNNLGAEYQYWSGVQWAYGAEALNRDKSSSFLWMDRIIRELVAKKPNLQEIVIGGFSGGAQFVNHYMAFNTMATELEGTGVSLSYVVGAPSIYLYVSSSRPGPACDTCNNYPYGLDNRTSYLRVSETSNSDARYRILTRTAAYITGTADTTGWTNTQAMAQGTNRIERMRKYKSHLTGVCAPGVYMPAPMCMSKRTFVEVSGVGHSYALFDNATARNILFRN